jgi:hypothetical protein
MRIKRLLDLPSAVQRRVSRGVTVIVLPPEECYRVIAQLKYSLGQNTELWDMGRSKRVAKIVAKMESQAANELRPILDKERRILQRRGAHLAERRKVKPPQALRYFVGQSVLCIDGEASDTVLKLQDRKDGLNEANVLCTAQFRSKSEAPH